MDFGLLHHIGPLAPPFKRSILDMASRNAHAIALDYVHPECPLWEFNRAKVIAVVTWMLEQADGKHFRTTMMIDKTRGVAVGFALHFSDPCSPAMGRILYAVVEEQFRGQGLFQRIVTSLCNEYNSLAMHCRPENIERIESLGFQAVGTEHSAIVMATEEGIYPKLPIPANLFLDSPQVREEDRKLREKMGTQALRQEFRAFIRKQCQEERRARRIFEERRSVVMH